MVFSKENQVIVTCNCGCKEGYIFTNKYGLIWVDTISSNFYTKQNSLYYKLKEKLERVLVLSKRKSVFLGEIILKEDEVKELLSLLKKLASEIDETEFDEDLQEYSKKKKSTLYLKNITDEFSEENEYTLEFKTPMTLKDILTSREYRSYDSDFTKEEILLFIKRAERLINKHQAK